MCIRDSLLPLQLPWQRAGSGLWNRRDHPQCVHCGQPWVLHTRAVLWRWGILFVHLFLVVGKMNWSTLSVLWRWDFLLHFGQIQVWFFFFFFLALQYRLWWPVADLVVSLMFSVNFDLFMTLKWVISRVNIDNHYKTELIASDVSCHHKLIFHWPYSEPDIQCKLWWLAYSWPCQSDVWQCVPDLAVGLNLTTSL